jgi:hypothetical protein
LLLGPEKSVTKTSKLPMPLFGASQSPTSLRLPELALVVRRSPLGFS